MEDLSHETGFVSTTLEALLGDDRHASETLAATIERAIQQETGRRVRNLHVEIAEDGVVLHGLCATYHCKQLAQHAAMAAAGGDRVTNAIEVM